MEWIIIDDGTDPIEDLVKDVPGVQYFRLDEKTPLGKKRNMMHEKSKGEIIVYMDDDDYYPPTRVTHAVQSLLRSRHALIAGSSILHIWFNDLNQMVQFGPYGPNHATAGTFAFKRELLKKTSFDENACLAEETHFLKKYTIPMVQLDPKHTILVFSHQHNTFDKRQLLKTKDTSDKINDSSYTVEDFIKDEELRNFYKTNLDSVLQNYEPGRPEHKPDVLKQTEELRIEREKKNC
jgi:glycosyltransferase involved in cell wall biosynthesis